MVLTVAILVELALLPSLLLSHRRPPVGCIEARRPRAAAPLALAAKAKAKKAKIKSPGGGGFGAPKAAPAAPKPQAAGVRNPFDNENFVISDYELPVEEGQNLSLIHI